MTKTDGGDGKGDERSGDAKDASEGMVKESSPVSDATNERPLSLADSTPTPATSSTDALVVSRRNALKPLDKVFDRNLMLRIWRMHASEQHVKVSGLHVSVRPGEKSTPDPRKRMPAKREEAEDRTKFFGTNMQSSKGTLGKKPDAFKASEKGYKIKEPTAREEMLEREVRSLLNKICPDNLKTIVERLALIDLHKAEELEFVIRIIVQKASAEPHYCETYADMVFLLKSRYTKFPPETPGEKPVTFTRVLLNTCQNEFETLPTTFEPSEEEKIKVPPEELKLEMKRRKDKTLANMKFIGNLFLRQLLAVKVIGQVVHDLVGIKDGTDNQLPEEHQIECVCELLQAIGFTLDGTPHGKLLMNQFSARLVDLRRHTTSDGRQAFSKRIQFAIQDLLDLRSNEWQKKLFKEQAKTKDDIRKDAAKELRQQQKGAGTEAMFSTQVVGVRPSYIDEFAKTAKPVKQQRPPETNTKPNWDQAYVKRLFQYYADEKNGDNLQADWQKAQPTFKENKQGIEWLLEIGFNDAAKEDIVAETITELVLRRVVTWEMLSEALSPTLSSLEELMIDVPQADVFFHSLLSRLLIASTTPSGGCNFNSSFLKPLSSDSSGDGEFAWKLFVGALRKVKDKAGTDGVRRTLDISEFANLVSATRKCSPSDLRRQLQEKGVL